MTVLSIFQVVAACLLQVAVILGLFMMDGSPKWLRRRSR